MMTAAPSDEIALLAQTACIWEATARKVGNVHPGAAFDDLEYTHFLIAAAVLGQVLSHWTRGPGITPPIGQSIDSGGGMTREYVGSNANLGIALLLVPLAVPTETTDFRSRLAEVLAGLTVNDARAVYKAIRRAAPGGLGRVNEQDIRDEPTVTLLEAMRLAANRDLVARQYSNGFADVFDFGVPALVTGFQQFGCLEAAIIDCQFRWLAEFPDSLIARKNGGTVAEDIRSRARQVLSAGGLDSPEGRAAGVALDQYLRSNGNKLNPGTTADLVTACLFVALREHKVTPSAPFRWNVEDWL